MSIATVVQLARELFESAPFITNISNGDDYEKALELVQDLIEDYDNNVDLIELLSVSITRWEDSAPEFEEFNKTIENLNSGIAVLNVIKDQYGLKNTDFQEEIGNKSMVSMILSGTRKLSLDHIKKLSTRFNIPVQSFI